MRNKTQCTFSLSFSAIEKLEKLVEIHETSKSDYLRILIESAYELWLKDELEYHKHLEELVHWTVKRWALEDFMKATVNMSETELLHWIEKGGWKKLTPTTYPFMDEAEERRQRREADRLKYDSNKGAENGMAGGKKAIKHSAMRK